MKKLKLLLPALVLAIVSAVVVSLIYSSLQAPKQAASPPPGVTDDTILIGSSLALGGHARFLGTETLRGSMAYLRYVNDNGGVNGRRIVVKAYDDGYDPPRCLANTLRLIRQDKVFALFDYVGTPTSLEVLPVIHEAKIPLVGIFSGAHALREPFQHYVINVRGSYYQETEMMVRHLVEDLGIKRLAVFYQYDSYGLDGLTGTEIALARYGLKPVATGSYVRGTMDVEAGLEPIIRSQAGAVIMIGTYDPCAKFIKLAHARGFHPVFLNVSFVGPEQLAERLGEVGNGVLVTQVVPPPTETMLLWGARQYVDLLAHYYPGQAPTFVGFEGYLNARVLVEGLRQAGRDLDREGFIGAIERIHSFSLGIANTLDYGQGDHAGLEQVYLTVIRGGRFQLITSGEVLRREQADQDCKVVCQPPLQGQAGER
jgi:branched-chain amino acid transport system substrate-binding protein